MMREIADQIEREHKVDYRARFDRDVVRNVLCDMERHVSGVEGAGDSPVALWARELRSALVARRLDPADDVSTSAYDLLPADEREAISWVREHGGLEALRVRLGERKMLVDRCRAYEDALDMMADSMGVERSSDKVVQARRTRKAIKHLTDLIEPTPTSSDTTATHTDASATCDVSQSRRDTVACDPTGRGVDSIYEWCRERLEGADGDEDELYCSIMRAIEEYRHPELVTARTVRAVDREALLALADELEKCAWYFGLDFDADEPLRDRLKEASEDFAGCARRIREACGEAVA